MLHQLQRDGPLRMAGRFVFTSDRPHLSKKEVRGFGKNHCTFHIRRKKFEL